MRYDRDRDARMLALMRAAKMLGGRVATWSTPPAHWPQRSRWIDDLERDVLALHSQLLSSVACHMISAALYADASKHCTPQAGGVFGAYMRSSGERAAIMSAFQVAEAQRKQARWMAIAEVLA